MSELEIIKSVITGNPVDFIVSVVDAARENTPDARRDRAFQEQVNELVLKLAKEWEEEKHKEKQRPSKEDVEKGLFRLADAYHEARNNKKRRMLYNAFYSYFRPEFYDEGISEILWEKVQDLEYPDVVFLAKIIDKTDPDERESRYVGEEMGPRRGDQLSLYESTEDAECADRLSSRGLVTVEHSNFHGVLLVSWRGVAKRLKEFALTEFWKEDPEGTKGRAECGVNG